jgi:hypothetical protein
MRPGAPLLVHSAGRSSYVPPAVVPLPPQQEQQAQQGEDSLGGDSPLGQPLRPLPPLSVPGHGRHQEDLAEAAAAAGAAAQQAADQGAGASGAADLAASGAAPPLPEVPTPPAPPLQEQPPEPSMKEGEPGGDRVPAVGSLPAVSFIPPRPPSPAHPPQHSDDQHHGHLQRHASVGFQEPAPVPLPHRHSHYAQYEFGAGGGAAPGPAAGEWQQQATDAEAEVEALPGPLGKAVRVVEAPIMFLIQVRSAARVHCRTVARSYCGGDWLPSLHRGLLRGCPARLAAVGQFRGHRACSCKHGAFLLGVVCCSGRDMAGGTQCFCRGAFAMPKSKNGLQWNVLRICSWRSLHELLTKCQMQDAKEICLGYTKKHAML